MARLRSAGECPWDREQTLETLRTYLLEETYELLEAIERREPELLQEELGDLLLEVVFLTQICSEQDLFSMDEVVRGIRDKLVRRHPHVFSDKPATNAQQAIQRWEEIKNKEKSAGAPDRSLLDGVPPHMPALLRAHRLSSKAGLVGFDWKALGDLYDKLDEEIAEFRRAAAAQDREAMQDELGDLLFIAANIGRYTGLDPEAALQGANRKFTSRFRHIEQSLKRQGLDPASATLEQMEKLWAEAKALERGGSEDGPTERS